MMQYSVYVRHCASKENMQVHIKRVRRSMPPTGFTSILAVTDKQYGDILNFWGKSERAKPEIPQQLEFSDKSLFSFFEIRKMHQTGFVGTPDRIFIVADSP